MRLWRDNAQTPRFPLLFLSVSLVYPWWYSEDTRSPECTQTHKCSPRRKAAPRTQSETLRHWFSTDAGEHNCSVLQHGHQLPGSPSAAADVPTWHITRGHTTSQPEVIWPQAYFLWLFCSSPPPSLHAENAFIWDSGKDWQTPEITCCSFCSDFSQGGQELPHGV